LHLSKSLLSLLLVALSFLPATVLDQKPEPEYAKDPAEAFVFIRTNKSMGSGSFIRPNMVLTAKHVVENTEWAVILGKFADGYKAHNKLDIAVVILKEEIEDIKCLPIAEPKAGEALAYLYAGGRVWAKKVVLSLERNERGYPLEEYRPMPGQSGSPIVQKGHVVGVITQLDFPDGGYWESATELLRPTPTPF